MVDNKFRLIAVTPSCAVSGEAGLIALMLESGISRVHLRHPGTSAGEIADILSEIPSHLYGRISLHDHHELCRRFSGVQAHLNSRNPQAPEGIPFSRSCHSLEEAQRAGDAEYCFLSPIFDSVSKAGYRSPFSIEKLREAASRGLINSRMIALGGVTPEKLPLLRELGFGGAAMLGYLWADNNPENLLKRIDAAVHYSHQQ